MGLTYYVDGASGSDTNNGDADHPFASMRKGFDAVRAGDVLTVRAGTYREPLGEVTLKGTSDAPILIQGEPGVVVRPSSIPSHADCIDEPGNVWAIPASTGARILEADEAQWQPIEVADPNGVHFLLDRPVVTHPVDSLELVHQVVGSNWFDAAKGLIYVHPYGSIDHGVELVPSQKVSFRGTDFAVKDIAFDYFSCVQTYNTQRAHLLNLSCCGSPVQVVGSTDTLVDTLHVEQVIKRGPGYEWHDKGEGQAFQVQETSKYTSVAGLTARHSWNGASFGGDHTCVDRAVLYGFPNHSFGVSGTDGAYFHVLAYQAQDSLFAQLGARCLIRHCALERAIVIGGGHTLTGKAFTELTLLDNTIHGGSVNCSNDTTITDSDRNYFITNYWDYRYRDKECSSLAHVQELYGLELNSVWDNRMLPR